MMSKIRILHVLNSLCVGGIESSVVSLCNNLDRSKYEVGLLILTDDYFELSQKIRSDVEIIVIPLKQRNSIILNILCLFFYLPNLVKRINEFVPNIVHTHIYQYNILPVLVAMFCSRLRFCHFHTIHTTGLHYIGPSMQKSIKLCVEKYCYKKNMSFLVCVSKEVARNSSTFFGESCSAIRTIENGVDFSLFNSIHNVKCSMKFTIIYVSRLVEGKNHMTLFRAFNRLLQRYNDLELLIVGDGELKTPLMKYVKDNKMDKDVHFYGNVENVSDILSISDLAVFPSEYEGFSVALIEMMAMKLPVICSDLQNFRDIFGSDGALYFSVHDDLQLSVQMEKLYLNKALLNHYAELSEKLAGEYSLERILKKYDEYYHFGANQMAYKLV